MLLRGVESERNSRNVYGGTSSFKQTIPLQQPLSIENVREQKGSSLHVGTGSDSAMRIAKEVKDASEFFASEDTKQRASRASALKDSHTLAWLYQTAEVHALKLRDIAVGLLKEIASQKTSMHAQMSEMQKAHEAIRAGFEAKERLYVSRIEALTHTIEANKMSLNSPPSISQQQQLLSETKLSGADALLVPLQMQDMNMNAAAGSTGAVKLSVAVAAASFGTDGISKMNKEDQNKRQEMMKKQSDQASDYDHKTHLGTNMNGNQQSQQPQQQRHHSLHAWNSQNTRPVQGLHSDLSTQLLMKQTGGYSVGATASIASTKKAINEAVKVGDENTYVTKQQTAQTQRVPVTGVTEGIDAQLNGRSGIASLPISARSHTSGYAQVQHQQQHSVNQSEQGYGQIGNNGNGVEKGEPNEGQSSKKDKRKFSSLHVASGQVSTVTPAVTAVGTNKLYSGNFNNTNSYGNKGVIPTNNNNAGGYSLLSMDGAAKSTANLKVNQYQTVGISRSGSSGMFLGHGTSRATANGASEVVAGKTGRLTIDEEMVPQKGIMGPKIPNQFQGLGGYSQGSLNQQQVDFVGGNNTGGVKVAATASVATSSHSTPANISIQRRTPNTSTVKQHQHNRFTSLVTTMSSINGPLKGAASAAESEALGLPFQFEDELKNNNKNYNNNNNNSNTGVYQANERFETMHSQQPFCAQSEEENQQQVYPLSYNFSSMIKTINQGQKNPKIQQQQPPQQESQSESFFMINNEHDEMHRIHNNTSASGVAADVSHGGHLNAQQQMQSHNPASFSKNLSRGKTTSEQQQLTTKYANINLKIKDFSTKKTISGSGSAVSSASANHFAGTSAGIVQNKGMSISGSGCLSSGVSSGSKLNLFEEFFVTGPNHADVSTAVAEMKHYSKATSFVTDSRVLFEFSAQDKQGYSAGGSSGAYESQSSVINEFTFPFGCPVEQMRLTQSFSAFNEILFANNSAEHSCSNVVPYVIALQSSQQLQQSQQPCGSSDQLQMQQQQQTLPITGSKSSEIRGESKNSMNINQLQQQSSNSNGQTLLASVNPRKVLYCICFRVRDFFESSKLMGNSELPQSSMGRQQQQQQQQYSTSNIQKSKMRFWQTEKVFCFVTYFPFVEFYFKVISHLLNLVKLKRIKAYNDRLDSIPNTLAHIDSDFFLASFMQLADRTLSDLLIQGLPELGGMLSANIWNERISFRIPRDERDVARLESEWGIVDAVSQFGLKDLVFLFVSILLEHSVVFVTKNISILTSTLMMFESTLLKPLKWTNPKVFNLPEKLLPLLDSPVPILAGINQEFSSIQEKGIDVEYPACVFVSLAKNNAVELVNAEVVENVPLEVFKEIMVRAEPAYARFTQQVNSNQHQSSVEGDEVRGAAGESRMMGSTMTMMMREKRVVDDAFALVESVSEFLRSEVIAKLPKSPIFVVQKQHLGLLDYEAMAAATASAANVKYHSFVHALFKTQMFTYFVEEVYRGQGLIV